MYFNIVCCFTAVFAFMLWMSVIVVGSPGGERLVVMAFDVVLFVFICDVLGVGMIVV